MEVKLIILLVFASLAQSSYVPTLHVNYGLSTKKQTAVLCEIMANQELTRTTCSDGIKTLFDTVFDLGAGTDACCSKTAKAFRRIKAAVDTSLDSDILALGESCSSAVEVARKAAQDNLNDALARIKTSLTLIKSGNYSINRAQIEVHHAAVQKNHINVVEIDYDLMNTCLCTTDAATQAVLEKARKGSLLGVIHIINALFNAIKVTAAAVPDGCGNRTLPFDIENFREKTLASLKINVEYKFGTLRALFINLCLNESGIVSGVALSQYTETGIFLQYMDANEAIFATAMSCLRRIDLGLYDDGDDSFSATDVSSARVVAAYDAGDKIILDFILFIHSDSFRTIATARKSVDARNVERTAAFFNAFYIAMTRGMNHSETLDSIETLRNATVSLALDYTRCILDLIRNKQTFDHKIEAELATLRDITLHGAATIINRIFDAAIVLANARYKGVVSKKYYSAIQVLQDEANNAIDYYAQGISATGLLVFRVITRE